VQNFETPLADPLVIIGAGCTFSSSLACLLARGESLESAIQQGKEYIYNAIITGIDTNLGVRKLLNHGVKF
jgi:phosphomethylpyrimidine kinase